MDICTLTESAQDQINTICSEQNCYAVSLNIKGGGCAGFEYEWGTVKLPSDMDEDDEVIKTENNYSFIIGVDSMMFLIGTEVDYVTSLVGSNFEINNPNAQSSCGCGVSVNFDLENIPQL